MDKKKMRKKIAALMMGVACFAAVFALAGCAPTSNEDDGGGQNVTDVNEYTVTFNANGGTLTGNSTVKVEQGEKVTGAPTAAKEGYTFSGWYTEAEGGTKVDLATYEVEGNVTLYAQYTQNAAENVTVTFDANTGKLTGAAEVEVAAGSKIPTDKIPVAEKEGYTFSGWYTAAEGGTKVDLATYEAEANVTLYAQYTEEVADSVTITFDANTGTLTGSAEVEIDVGGYVPTDKIPAAEKEGYLFLGWFDAAEGGEEVIPDFAMFETDTTIYAQWAKAYTVTFDPGDGTMVGDSTVVVAENQTISKTPSATLDGSEFYGWYTAAEGGEKVDLNTYKVTADVTLYAQYGYITMPLKNLKDHEGASVGYRIEAEEAKIEGTLGSGGTTFIEENIATASGTKSVGYFGVVGNTITFTFVAEEAGTAEISLRATSNNTQFDMSSGWTMWVDDQVVNQSIMSFTFNGQAVNYDPATLRGAGKDMPMTWNLYWDPVSLGELEVKEGINTLVLKAEATTVPNIDCLDIETDIVLTSANGDAASGEAQLPEPPAPEVVYEGDVVVDLYIGAYEGGPAINKAVLDFGTAKITKEALASKPLTVTLGGNLGATQTDKFYLCDENGNALPDATESQYVAIEYQIGYSGWSFTGNLSPFSYQTHNNWKDLSTVGVNINGTLAIGDTAYSKMGDGVTFGERIIPDLEGWDLDGEYTSGEGEDAITLTYGSYATEAMENDGQKNPLIIWLHGAGEGGTDPTINILGNQVTNLSKDLIQKYFTTETVKGAYVLAPQTPTAWMDGIYNDTLFALIQNYVETNGDIDTDRIYVGGCSNGGWMTVALLSEHADYFAAAYPICEAYTTEDLTDDMINAMKDVPIWFTHSANDGTVGIYNTEFDMGTWQNKPTTPKEAYTNSLYIRLINAGAKNVYYSLFSSVLVDGVNYDGHWSWIYALRDECVNVQATSGKDGAALTINDLDPESTNTVKVDGEDVTLWGWLAAQVKAAD